MSEEDKYRALTRAIDRINNVKTKNFLVMKKLEDKLKEIK